MIIFSFIYLILFFIVGFGIAGSLKVPYVFLTNGESFYIELKQMLDFHICIAQSSFELYKKLLFFFENIRQI